MPEIDQLSYYPATRTFEQTFVSGPAMRTSAAYVKKEALIPSVMSAAPDAQGCLADRALIADMGEAVFQAGQSPKKSRAKESSKHFGVRFRPDLSKWVAEIRVAEWKSVDKKVWLGTFDSEEGAARAVDAARKLLKCKKKRAPNFPCEALTAYSERIPASLNLNNLRDDSMFKEVTLFVKRKAQDYAASFCPNKTACISINADQILAKYTEAGAQEMECFSFGSDGQWTSSAGTSPEEQKSSWTYYPDPCFGTDCYPQVEEQCVEGGWSSDLHTAVHVWDMETQDTETCDSNIPYGLGVNEQWLNDPLFPDHDLFFEETAMDLIPEDEMPVYMESLNPTYSISDAQLPDWTQQPYFTSYPLGLMSPMEYSAPKVC